MAIFGLVLDVNLISAAAADDDDDDVDAAAAAAAVGPSAEDGFGRESFVSKATLLCVPVSLYAIMRRM
eukprot:CAMPEP_0197542568 /NCGR_PEP_ID=MMETSP1318-20131121/67774_1 /TAXON_ID=552666 /ORGANISM="Partenskyella glossopodia, Strain RCC365" /LENGTH=67 /DNA_ID=CAMNT_0043101841 /DNA_START=775 /DNA_END=978 /DNA_ORIENTATION=-